jgi:glycosyltransferase involved in cell wall biosynthesis
MKIVHVVDSMEVGGAEMLVSQMCQFQRAQGHVPCVYAVSALGLLGERMRGEGFTVEANVGRHLVDATGKFLRLFRESRPDVVHLHNPTPTIYAALSARVAGVSNIISTRHSLVAPPHRLAAELKYAVAARFCDWVVGICDATTENLNRMHTVPGRKIVRIYNGAIPLSRTPIERWPTKSGFTLVYVGRLEPVKNHGLLLSAFRAALSSMPGLRLWMVGDGSQRASLESLARELDIWEQVTFWGQQLDVAPFLSAADVFMMSSTSEGLPMSLLQAFSLQLPAIVTDVGGMAEVVRKAQAGLTVSATDPAEMAAAILRLAGSDPEREHFSNNALRAYQTDFSAQTMVEAYMDLYEKAAKNSTRVVRCVPD